VREQLLNQQAQAQQVGIATTQGQYINQLATGLMGKSLTERATIVAQQLPLMQQLGFNPAEILSQDLSDQGLQGVITQTQPFMQPSGGAAGGGGFQFGATQTVQKPDGSLVSVTQVRDPQTGGVRVVEVPIGGELVSGIGETAQERQAREVETAGQKAEVAGAAETGVLVGREEALREGEVATQEALGEVELDIAARQS
jgi:hypothetical protein